MLSVGLVALVLASQGASAQQQGGPVPTAEAMAADTGTMRHANHRTPPLAYAARLSGAKATAIRIDGRLDEAIWAQARPATQFWQAAPREGEPATERTNVRIVYDDNAVTSALGCSSPIGMAFAPSSRGATHPPKPICSRLRSIPITTTTRASCSA